MQLNPLPKITAKQAVHRNKKILKLFFPYEGEIVEKIRSLAGVLWSNSMKCWYIPDNDKSLGNLHKLEGVSITIENAGSEYEGQFGEGGSGKKQKLLVVRYQLHT